MSDADKFGLVPKPPGSLEKAEPGTKRILSGMVADTLALARVDSKLEQWCLLGEDYYFGIGRPSDSSEAVKWFRMAAEKGHSRAQCWLGYCYQRSCGIKEDMTEGARWFQAAAKQGEITAQYNLGVCFEGGLGVPADRKNMIEWYEKAADRGHNEARYRLGVCSLAGNEENGLKWLERAAEQGHIKSQLELGRLHSLPGGQISEAVTWYRKAADGDSAEAQAELGRCFEQGAGVRRDEIEAVKLFRKAAKNGGKDGQYYLGSCYAEGKGVARDTVEASKWFRQAAEQGRAEAQFEIGIRYETGEGVPQNRHEAMRWLSKAAECEGFVAAQRYLAKRFILDGEPVEAWPILRLAAEEGKDRSALGELNTLRPLMTQEQIARAEEHFGRLLERHSWKHKRGIYDLETPVKSPKPPGSVNRPRCKRPLRIIVLDDEPFVGEALQMMLRFDLPDSFILTFTSAESALQELEREDPDLFTTDIHHVGITCPELLTLLAVKKVKCPVFVISAALSLYDEATRRGWGPGLDVSFLSKPFLLDDLRNLLRSHLGLDYPELGNLAR